MSYDPAANRNRAGRRLVDTRGEPDLDLVTYAAARYEVTPGKVLGVEHRVAETRGGICVLENRGGILDQMTVVKWPTCPELEGHTVVVPALEGVYAEVKFSDQRIRIVDESKVEAVLND